MKNIESSIHKLINILKTIEPYLKKEGKVVMLVETSSSKNKKKKKSIKAKEGVAKKKAKKTTLKGTCVNYGKSGH